MKTSAKSKNNNDIIIKRLKFQIQTSGIFKNVYITYPVFTFELSNNTNATRLLFKNNLSPEIRQQLYITGIGKRVLISIALQKIHPIILLNDLNHAIHAINNYVSFISHHQQHEKKIANESLPLE